MIKKLIILSFLCLAILVGAAYYLLWPLAQQYLATVANVLQPAIENIADPKLLPPEGGMGLGGLIAVLPILQKIGIETLIQIRELTADGVTMEEAQQAMDILRNRLSAEELAKLLAAFNL